MGLLRCCRGPAVGCDRWSKRKMPKMIAFAVLAFGSCIFACRSSSSSERCAITPTVSTGTASVFMLKPSEIRASVIDIAGVEQALVDGYCFADSEAILSYEAHHRDIAAKVKAAKDAVHSARYYVRSGLTVNRPEFSGEIGHLEKSEPFTSFIYDSKFQVVLLDVWLPERDLDGRFPPGGQGESSFVLWEQCRDLAPQEAYDSTHCTGTHYTIENAPAAQSGPWCTRGACKLSGYFAVSGFGGPHQGLMGTTLRPVPVEEVR